VSNDGIVRHAFIQKAVLSLEISKVALCLMVAFSSLFGYMFAAQALSFQSFFLFLSVLLLACGGASLNSYQEREEDRLMTRTKERPLVQGRLSCGHALIQASLLIGTGLFSLLLFTGVKAFGAGLLGILLYNAVYTRMKSWSLYAIIPGAVCGAIPPYIGWLAAGGEGVSFRATLPVLLLFFWQVPHVFLVILNHKTDYRGSRSPNILSRLSEQALRRIFLPWITALATIMLTFSVLPSLLDDGSKFVIVVNTGLLLGLFYYQMMLVKNPNYKILFQYLNFSLFLLMVVVCIGSLG
jgi:protoheme IX farnesyltransferase